MYGKCLIVGFEYVMWNPTFIINLRIKLTIGNQDSKLYIKQ